MPSNKKGSARTSTDGKCEQLLQELLTIIYSQKYRDLPSVRCAPVSLGRKLVIRAKAVRWTQLQLTVAGTVLAEVQVQY